MKTRFLSLCLVAAFWLPGMSGCDSEVPVTNKPAPPRDTLIPKKGPFAKVVVEPLHDFGVMEVGQKGNYAFIVTNGSTERELIIKNTGEKSCTCTTSLLKKATIPPGKSAKVEIKWKIRTNSGPIFEQYVVIQTSDPGPKKEYIRLVVKGTVAKAIELMPSGPWVLGPLRGGKSVTYTGHLVSGISDSIPKPNIEIRSKFIKVKYKRMTREELDEIGSVKDGYNIFVTVSPNGLVGHFEEQIVIHTENAKHRKLDLDVNVTGSRNGPIDINPGGGIDWVSEWDRKNMVLKFPEFLAKDGIKQSLVLFVSGLKKGETLKIKEGGIESKPKSLFEKGRLSVKLEEIKTDAKKPTAESTRPKYLLTFTIKPGNARLDYLNRKRALIRLKTTHDEAKVIEIVLEFLAN